MAQINTINNNVLRLYEGDRDAPTQIHIPVQGDLFATEISEGSPAQNSAGFTTVVLKRQHFTIHITYDLIFNLLFIFRFEDFRNYGLNIPTEIAQPLFMGLAPVLHPLVSEFMQFINNSSNQEYPSFILNRVDLINQPESGLIALDFLFHAEEDTEAYRHSLSNLIERLVQECIMSITAIHKHSGFDGFSYEFETNSPFERIHHEVSINSLYRDEFAQQLLHLQGHNIFGPDYDVDAEEKAMDLLKNMIKPSQFKMYKEKGYLYIKGTYGRKYKIQKHGMMEVKQTRLGKTKKYRLCIEPAYEFRFKICPTDEVIAKIKYIRTDEKLLHEKANKFNY